MQNLHNGLSIKTNLKELNDLSPAPFTNEPIVCLQEYLDERGIYLLPGFAHSRGSIDLSSIRGHSQCYDQMKWGDCLAGHHLKRLKRNLQHLADNPEYYLNGTKKEGISFIKIENDYFICEGKHRTIISRFLEHHNPEVFDTVSPLTNVSIHERKIDYEFMAFAKEVNQLRAIYPDLEFIMDYTHREDECCLYVNPKDYRLPSGYFTRSELPACIEDFKNPSLRKKLNSCKSHQLITLRTCMKAAVRKVIPFVVEP